MIDKNVMKNNVFILYYIAATLLLFSCCDKGIDCRESKTITYNFSEEELTIIPYNGRDTLKFTDQDGDTSILVGTGKTFYYDTKMSQTAPADCPSSEDLLQYQACRIDFVPIKGDLGFSVSQHHNERVLIITNPYNKVTFKNSYAMIGIEGVPVTFNGVTYHHASKFVEGPYEVYYSMSYGVLSVAFAPGKKYSILK